MPEVFSASRRGGDEHEREAPPHTIAPVPTDDEAAAIAAVLALLEHERVAAAQAAARRPDQRSLWVDASRRAAQRAGLQRGPWRVSGRIARRSRT